VRLRVGPQFTGSERLEFARGGGETIEINVPDKRNGSGSCEARYNLTERNNLMLWTIFVILLVLWLLGFIGHFGGALIHLLLVIAVIVLIVNLVGGRRPL
jgi:hypothetical protein